MKKTSLIVLVTVFAIAASAPADPVHFSVTATATYVYPDGVYTYGESYTFEWVVSDTYTGGSADDFPSFADSWGSGGPADPPLWVSISGDELTGTYSRPNPSSENLVIYDTDLSLDAENKDPGSSTMGLMYGGLVAVKYISTSGLAVPGVDVSGTEFVNPAVYWSAYTGTYAQSSGQVYIETADGRTVGFSATNLTITPEPATLGLMGIGGVLLARSQQRKNRTALR